ncbi:MAG: 1,2-phenylacetyl-CoA epoxidase subunit PaaC [Pseudomonadota bacterium]
MTDGERLSLALRMGDSALVLGHRLSELSGHAPVLEEELATANVALDLVGQADLWLRLAATLLDDGRDADALAYLRDGPQFRNLLLVEQPNGDYGHTLMRQFLFDCWHFYFLAELESGADAACAEIAAKGAKEVRYHLERSSDWVIRLGDGTDESRVRMLTAVERLWPYTAEMFDLSAMFPAAAERVSQNWRASVAAVFAEATLDVPEAGWAQRGGLDGRHTEHLGRMLAEMQFLQRAYPGAQW